MSFAQRKYLGFRNRYEFDKKRFVFASKQEFAIKGFDHGKKVYDLIRAKIKPDEEIRFMSFIEDYIHKFLFLITHNQKE